MFDNEYCIMDNKFRDLVTKHNGWVWKDERKPDSPVSARVPWVVGPARALNPA